jgi:hypothetical protein
MMLRVTLIFLGFDLSQCSGYSYNCDKGYDKNNKDCLLLRRKIRNRFLMARLRRAIKNLVLY